MKFKRRSGILLHITSLPGKYGIGSLGKDAFEFIDFLESSGQKTWQICPTGPTGYGDSPYQTFSAFAGNPLFIDLEKIVEDGFLLENDLETETLFPGDRVDFGKVIDLKNKIFRNAFKTFQKKIPLQFPLFCEKESDWLDDYALFISLKGHFNGKPWNEWENEIKLREPDAISKYEKLLNEEILYHKFLQYLFFKQWKELHEYARSKDIKIFGDIPIYIALDSSDAWANPEYFQFDEHKNPIQVSGCPPDDFCKLGQLWGNPLYDWQKHEQENFRWWIKRFRKTLEIVDIVRIDHFIGFVHYFAIPAENETAEIGEWLPGSGKKLFEAVQNKLGDLPIIAEDLGLVTEKVIELRVHFQFPGMRLLQFAFGGDESNPFFPKNYPENCVVYTGTHDNETTEGWYKNIPEFVKEHLHRFLDYDGKEKISWKLLEVAWKSKADLAIAPMQDFLGLDNSARFNSPGSVGGNNWKWRVKKEQLSKELARKIKKITVESRR